MGREEILGELLRAVCSQRLVTLHGVAGVGKSALLRLASLRLEEAGAFPAGIYWVSLREVSHSGVAKEAITRVIPTSSEACLVVLDGADRVAAITLAHTLLARFPHLHLALTVRRPLELAEECALFLSPLAPSDTRRLLVSGATQELDPSETAALARLLDGNPQAVRFVAPLLAMEPLATLRTAFETVLTARALQGEEHNLALSVARDLLLERLPDTARNLLGVVSLFSWGALQEDLEAVWGESGQEALDLLQRSGLVSQEAGRYQVAVDLPETPPQAMLGPTGLLLALALGHLRTGNTDAAFDLGERALTKAQRVQNRAGFVRALLVLGVVALEEDPARAVLLFEEAATHAESLGEPCLQGEARYWEGCAFKAISEPEAALAAFYEAWQGGTHSQLGTLFSEIQVLLTGYGGESLLAALATDAVPLRESGLLAARVRLGLPGK